MASCRRFMSRWRCCIRAIILLYIVALVFFTFRTSLHADYLKGIMKTHLQAADAHIARAPRNYTRPSTAVQRTEPVRYFASKYISDDILSGMLHNNNSFCNGRFVGFDKMFARLYDVVIEPKHGHGRQGGENMSYVINQKEADEYYTLDGGFFNIQCEQKIQYQFGQKDHLNQWLAATSAVGRLPAAGTGVARWTIAVLRYEYVNLYHTMTDFYNAFLLIRAFSIEPDDVDILWIDGHPEGGLDATWAVLFGRAYRVGELTEPIQYQRLLWNIMGYSSPMNKHNSPSVPYIEEFREFFLGRHGIHGERTLNCANLTVLFLWRRDYLAHPRNPTGLVSRKVKNEDELLASVSDLLPGHSVRGIQIDLLPMREQLKLISEVDILIGMHGAGLSHTLFLPRHAGLVELYPTYWSQSNGHFRAMSTWRHLQYSVWVNTDHTRELSNKYTVVDAQAVVNMVHEMDHKICGDRADAHD